MNMMTNNLPEGLALVETADGRWFPALAPLIETPGWVALLGETDIPPALIPLHDARKGYHSRHETVEACQAWHEAATFPVHWRSLATQTEVYPERNAWYREEIACLTGDTPMLQPIGGEVLALVFNTRLGVCAAAGLSPDEAIEALYQAVSAFCSREEQAEIQRRAS